MKIIHTHRTSDFNTVQFSKELRKNQTKAELILWKHLKKKQLCRFKFRRQHPIGSYIADFYCNETALVIEVDGNVHSDSLQKQKDKLRDSAMENHGIKVVRFQNEDIENNISNVLKDIYNALKAAIKNPPPMTRRPPGEDIGRG